ncbi:MAG TPA: hypothetical protein VHL52_12745 [Acidimicrobiia bacterium]|nr:hypothetical protein [Acidimicrobiia bacterium]
MAEVELALAASTRPWVDSLHRFLADHGGARVRTVLMGAEDALSESYDALIIDDVCSFLTPRLVEQVRRRGRLVVGVFDSRDGADAKRRLLECGVDDVVEDGASPDEFVAVVRRVLELAPPTAAPMLPSVGSRTGGRVVVVGAPPGGCGATEVAVGLAISAHAMAVDADDVAPSLAQRVGAPLHPNLRTAIDIVHHQSGSVEDAVIETDSLRLVAGLVNGDDWAQLHPGEVEAVIDEVVIENRAVVVNVGSGLERPQLGEGRFGLARGLVVKADAIIAVGLPHPVGLTRLVRWVLEAADLAPESPVIAAVNRIGRSPYQRTEVATELARALPGVPVHFLPEDKRVTEAAWAGTSVPSGPFRRSIRKLAAEVGL